VGPAIAGLRLLDRRSWCFLFTGLSFFAVILALMAMRIQPQERKPSTNSAIAKFAARISVCHEGSPIRSALLLAEFVESSGLQYSVFMPIFANDILHAGARGLGS